MALTGSIRESFALAVASGQSVTRAAKKLSIGRRTATRWLADPSFSRRVSALRGEMTARALGVISASAARAAGRLRKLLDDPQPAIRHKAAVAILDQCPKLSQYVEIEGRLAALEASQPVSSFPYRNGVLRHAP